MSNRAALVVLLTLISVSPITAGAGLTVIDDNGHTQPIAPFLDVFGARDTQPPRPPPPRTPELGAANPANLLPIISEGLTPGPVKGRVHGRPFARPFFLIGADGYSRRWLQAHRDRLKALGAVGMLVQAETVADLRTIAGLAKGLPILPGSATDIAQALGVRHYPVLITQHGLEQ